MKLPAQKAERRWLQVALFALLVARIVSAVLVAPPVVADAQGYEASAVRLAGNGSFAYPLMSADFWSQASGRLEVTDAGRERLLGATANAYTMPGYPAFRAAIMRITHTDEDASRVWTRVAQAILSVVCAALIFAIGSRFGRRTGWLALLLAAIYPPFTLANSYLATEVLFVTLLLASMYLVLRWSDQMTVSSAALAGVVFGASLWVRPSMALWIPAAAALVVAANRQRLRKAMVQAVVLGAAVMLAMAPWWIRNYTIYERVVPFSTSGAVTAIEAVRMDVAEQLPLPWLRSAPPQTTEQKRVERAVLRVYDSAPAQDPTDIELSDYYAAAGTRLRSEMMRTHLGVLVVSRGRSLANSILWPHAVSMKVAGGIPYALAWAFHMIILTFFAVGCAVAPRRLDTALLLSLPAYSLLLHAVVIPLHRYHFPVMPVVTVIAAIGLDALVSRLRSSCDTRSEYRTEHAATT